ncbi:MAG: hypothetical protein KF787_10640 [Phycisphaeraceae bacterium]|nr:hypothetical protein [Phycisphaerae bacterium]MBX3393092.1 hypothetical protein [Phycisphaeraceae bacterium]
MEAFGSFEAIDVAREGNFGAVMYARRAGTSEKRFAVKVFRPPELLMDDDQIEREAACFIEAAQNQQRAHGALPAGWAPVHEFGLCQGGAWYATDLMECSLEILRITQRDLEPDHIRKIIEPVVQGLVALRQTQGRAHGNIKPTNVLIQGRADLSRARIVLSDPKPTSRCRSPEDDQRDARDLGDLVHQLVLHKPFQNLTEWPIQNTDRWQRLGRVGAAWLELVNRLLDPTTTSKPSIDEIAASLPGGPVKVSPTARDADRAEAERKAREEQAREEESRRKAREAEIAQRVRAEAEKKAKEEAERKAQAQRKAEEADRAAREAEARRAEEERRRSEQQAREAAAAAEKARREQEEIERKSREEKARQQKEQAERARKEQEQEQARLLDRERAEQEARRKADAEIAEKAQRAARENARQADAEARAGKQAEESAATSPAAPAVGTVDTPSAPAPGKSGGGSKKAILAVAAMVVVGGGLAAVFFLGGGPKNDPVTGDGGGGGQSPVVVTDPPRPTDTSTAGGSGTIDAGGTPPTPTPTPTPTVPTTAQVEEAVRRNIGMFEQRLVADLAQAATERAGEHERLAADRVRQAAAGAALTRASEADVASSEGVVSAAARASAVQAARAALADGYSPTAPPWTSRPEVGRVRSDLITRVKGEFPDAPDDATMAATTAAIQGLIDREWKRLADEALQSQADRVSAAAADGAMEPARQAFAARVEEARRIAASSAPATEPTPAAPTQQELAALMAAASGIGRDLDSGSGADDGGEQARAAMTALERSPWFDRVAQDGAVTRIRARIEALERIASADAVRAIPEARGAISSVGGASEALAAWTRISSVGGAADLNEIAALREATVDWAANLPDPAVRQRIERAANQAARDLWSARAVAAQDDAAIDAVRALRERMAVGDGDVPPGVAFNFALRDFKQAVAGATGPTNQRVEALKAPARAFVDVVGTLGPVASQQVVEASVAAAREILDWQDPGPAPSGGGGDLTRAGPGSVGWVAAPAADGMSVTYTWPAEGATRPEQRLTFRRIDTPGGRSVYLGETEIPVSLYRRLFGPDFAANDREFTSPTSGLKAWSIDRGTVVLAAEIIEHPTITLRNNRPLTLQNIQRWSGLANLDSIAPAWTWPLQYISPRAAVVIAGKIGCRLPSVDEWRAASRRAAGQEPNLRDASWFGVLDAARNYDFKGNPVYPDHGSIRRQGLNADGRDARDDGYPFFSPVDTGPDGTWKNLIGNVAEWVFADPITGSDPIADSFDKVDRGWRFAVVGGSAVGPASIAGVEAEPILDHRNGSFFDVGFRVAFTATPGGAPGPVFDDTKIAAISGAAYLPPGR